MSSARAGRESLAGMEGYQKEEWLLAGKQLVVLQLSGCLFGYAVRSLQVGTVQLGFRV